MWYIWVNHTTGEIEFDWESGTCNVLENDYEYKKVLSEWSENLRFYDITIGLF